MQRVCGQLISANSVAQLSTRQQELCVLATYTHAARRSPRLRESLLTIPLAKPENHTSAVPQNALQHRLILERP